MLRHDATLPCLLAVAALACLSIPSSPAKAGHTASLGIGVGTASPINTESAVTLPRDRWAAGIRTEYTNFEHFSDAELVARRESHPEAGLHAADSVLSTFLPLRARYQRALHRRQRGHPGHRARRYL